MNVSKELALGSIGAWWSSANLSSKLMNFFAPGKMPGFIHLCVGEEAIAAGVTPICTSTTTSPALIAATGTLWRKAFRAHEALAELLGKEGGCNGGRGGSMHLYKPAGGIPGNQRRRRRGNPHGGGRGFERQTAEAPIRWPWLFWATAR